MEEIRNAKIFACEATNVLGCTWLINPYQLCNLRC